MKPPFTSSLQTQPAAPVAPRAFTIEPELLRPTPRVVRYKPRSHTTFHRGCVSLFLLPFLLSGLWLLTTAVSTSAVLLFGQVVPATITARSTTQDSEGGTTYYLEYSFLMNGATHVAKESVASNEYDFWRDGSVVNVRAWPLFPTRAPQLQLGSKKSWTHAAINWGIALFWNGCMLVAVFVLFVAPVLQRRLVQRGVPTIGRICDKTTQSDDSTSYFLHYEYAPIEYTNAAPKGADAFASPNAPPLPTPLKGQNSVSKDDYATAQIGDLVTVLFDVRQPKRSTIYRFADYEIVP